MHVEAGAGGLNRYVVTAGILDYEYVDGVKTTAVPFDESSFVISSLLFAKDEPTLILPAVKSLNSHGISAFAYKKIFFDQLPQEVKDFAESNNFPILSFDGDSYFENIIFEIMDAVEHDNARILSESRIQHIIDNEPTASEALELKRNLSLHFKKYTAAAYFAAAPNTASLDTNYIIRNFYHNKFIGEKAMLGAYNGGIMLLMTASAPNQAAFKLIWDEYIEIVGISSSEISTGFSQVHESDTGLPRCIRESYFAYRTMQLFPSQFNGKEKLCSYRDIGTFKMLMPLAKNPVLAGYAGDYLAPLESSTALLSTAKAWVFCGGDYAEAARVLNCHQNTIRYRIAKIKEMLEPNICSSISDFQLYERLAAAIKISILTV